MVEGHHCPSEGVQGPLWGEVQSGTYGWSTSCLSPLPQSILTWLLCWGVSWKKVSKNVYTCWPGPRDVLWGLLMAQSSFAEWFLACPCLGSSLALPICLLLSDHLLPWGARCRCRRWALPAQAACPHMQGGTRGRAPESLDYSLAALWVFSECALFSSAHSYGLHDQ